MNNPPVSRWHTYSIQIPYYQELLPSTSGFHVIPDGQGGVLVPYNLTWTAQYYSTLPLWEQHVAHVSTGGGVSDFVLPFQPTENPQEFPLVLSENGNVIGTDGVSAVAFSPSGSVQWTYTPQNGVDSMVAAAGGGLVILDKSGSQIPLDANGNSGDSVSGFAATAPWTLGLWISTSEGYTASKVGLLFDVGLSVWPAFRGSLIASNSPQLPSFAHFLVENPLNSQTNYSVQSFKSDMLSRGYLPSDKADHAWYFTGDATLKAFKTSANKRENAVAFIGHSIENQSNGQSLGIRLYDFGLVKTGYTYSIPVRRYNVFPTNARILFFGSCNDGSVFESLWGIKDNQNNGRAIIVPDSPNQATHLDWAAKAWLTIATLLAEGKDVETAVKAGNDYLTSQNLFGNSWKAVGDHHAKIVY